MVFGTEKWVIKSLETLSHKWLFRSWMYWENNLSLGKENDGIAHEVVDGMLQTGTRSWAVRENVSHRTWVFWPLTHQCYYFSKQHVRMILYKKWQYHRQNWTALVLGTNKWWPSVLAHRIQAVMGGYSVSTMWVRVSFPTLSLSILTYGFCRVMRMSSTQFAKYIIWGPKTSKKK